MYQCRTALIANRRGQMEERIRAAKEQAVQEAVLDQVEHDAQQSLRLLWNTPVGVETAIEGDELTVTIKMPWRLFLQQSMNTDENTPPLTETEELPTSSGSQQKESRSTSVPSYKEPPQMLPPKKEPQDAIPYKEPLPGYGIEEPKAREPYKAPPWGFGIKEPPPSKEPPQAPSFGSPTTRPLTGPPVNAKAKALQDVQTEPEPREPTPVPSTIPPPPKQDVFEEGCLKLGGPMILKRAHRGGHLRECMGYPACQGSRRPN